MTHGRFLLAAALALAVSAGVGAWLMLRAPDAEAAGEALPLPPDAPRLADGADYEHCLGLLRHDPDAARAFAGSWEVAGGGEGARHCAALAMLAQDEPEQAAERLEALAARSRGSAAARASIYAQAGQAWVMAGQPGRAFGAATLGLTLAPDDADLMMDRAVALGALGRYAESLADLDRALALDAGRAEAWVFRAAALRRLDRSREAIVAIARALQLMPDSAEALLERGILRQMAGDLAGARADWRRAIAVAPASAAADLAQQNLALNEAGPQRR